MRVTTNGQVTIPVNVREELGIIPKTDIDFMEENGRFYIVKMKLGKKKLIWLVTKFINLLRWI